MNYRFSGVVEDVVYIELWAKNENEARNKIEAEFKSQAFLFWRGVWIPEALTYGIIACLVNHDRGFVAGLPSIVGSVDALISQRMCE